jgi:hypothetical protein
MSRESGAWRPIRAHNAGILTAERKSCAKIRVLTAGGWHTR